jgi:hypothetical protein
MPKNDKNESPEMPHTPKTAHDIDPENMGEHEGATEDQVSDTPAPAGGAFEDDPKQG